MMYINKRKNTVLLLPLLEVKDEIKEILKAKGFGKDIENSIKQKFN